MQLFTCTPTLLTVPLTLADARTIRLGFYIRFEWETRRTHGVHMINPVARNPPTEMTGISEDEVFYLDSRRETIRCPLGNIGRILDAVPAHPLDSFTFLSSLAH